MKVLAYHKFGTVDVLNVESVPAQAAPRNGVLVDVRASSINVIDSRSRRGEMSPFVNKKFPKVPGVDFSGVVSAIGTGVSRTKVGDAVYGATNPFKGGALAETVAVSEDSIAPKPPGLSFEEAAAIPLAGAAALISLRNLGKLQPGQKVLIYGSSGGVGLMAIQLAKHFGAHVTTVSGGPGVKISRDLGAETAIDYTAGLIRFSNQFDIIADFSGKFPFDVARKHLTPHGRFIESSPSIPKFIGSMLANLFRSQKNLMLTAEAHRADLEFLSSLVESGKLRVKVAKVFPIDSAQQAFREQETGGVIGKIVIAVA